MSSKRVYTDYLNDIFNYAEKAQQFVQGVSFQEFQRNEEKIFAVLRAMLADLANEKQQISNLQ